MEELKQRLKSEIDRLKNLLRTTDSRQGMKPPENLKPGIVCLLST